LIRLIPVDDEVVPSVESLDDSSPAP